MGPRGRSKVIWFLMLSFKELGSGNGEAGPVTLVNCRLMQCVVLVVVR